MYSEVLQVQKYHIIYSTTGVFTKKNYNDAVYKKAFFINIGISGPVVL